MRTDPYKLSGAGRWFPSDGDTLRDMVKASMAAAEMTRMDTFVHETPLGAIAPHAGFAYSGAVAGHTYRALRETSVRAGWPDLVVVLGFSHRIPFSGLALLEAESIHTPLGDLTVDAHGNRSLLASVPCAFGETTLHVGEHSAENQLPFLQLALPDVPVVVGLVGGHEHEVVGPIAEGLLALGLERRILVLASTDLLHDPDYERVCRSDRQTLCLLEKLDLEGLREAWSVERQVCCGVAPVSVLLTYAWQRGCRKGHCLSYQNSGDVDRLSRGSWVVGYGSVVYGIPAT